MTNHTGTVCACQPHAHPPRPDSTPPPLDTSDRRLVVRYGAWLLVGGYTALPTYAWVYYARLGVSEAEMVLIAQLCTYWWTERAPHPGEAALAARMGKTVRTIQGYLRSLEGKGLLHIQTRLSTNGRQSTNAYDLRPFFTAVEGLARLDDLLPANDATLATSGNGSGHQPQAARDNDACNAGPRDQNDGAQGDAEREPLCAEMESTGPAHTAKAGASAGPRRDEGSRAGRMKNLSPQVNPIEIETFDLDSIPPTPANATLTTGASDDQAQADDNVGDQLLVAEITALSAELGDDAPRSSLGRARNLCHDAGMSLGRFLPLLDEAAARTRDRQASIVKRRRDGQAPNGMPYLFAVLQDLLHPVPAKTRMVDVGLDRQRDERPGRRRRRRADGRGEPAGSYAAWSDSPPPLPIVEEHPVWRAVLAELAQVMTSENFNAWLATTRALDQDGGVLRVAVPTPFNKTWLEHKLAGRVAAALHKIDGDTLGDTRVARVAYVVAAAA
jgi:hypothetical protein